MSKRLKVLMVVEQCNPEWFSVPLVGYSFYQAISQYADITLVTHERNRAALEKIHGECDIVYINEVRSMQRYASVAGKISQFRGKIIWPLFNTLMYPVYANFNHLVYKAFSQQVLNGEFDLVHVLTPMMPRYPIKLVKVCQQTPLIIGPVNGGIPFPAGFKEVGSQEFSYLNFLRGLGRHLIPGYRETYEGAAKILSGSSYTKQMLLQLFKLPDERIDLMYENGIRDSFFERLPEQQTQTNESVRLLFVGRLVPYKGADMLIDAIAALDENVRSKIILTIVGDGAERSRLEQMVEKHGLQQQVNFTGWVAQQETLTYYQQADVFCFPSVREFGGAVVLEAMSNQLPCIVVDYGGIGEYVVAGTGFKIAPQSRQYVVTELTRYIHQIIEDPDLRKSMSAAALVHAKSFSWSEKGKTLFSTYQQVIENRKSED